MPYIIQPRKAGQPLLSSNKQQRNKPCSCGSGRKAKQCCGEKTEYRVMEKPEPAKYVYISLSHTHKQDKFFTFWRAEGKGYCFDCSIAGLFKQPIATETEISVLNTSLIPYLIKSEDHNVIVLPNTSETRKALGITQKQLTGKHKYQF